MSLPKKSDKNAGRDEPILLIPELCALTGTVLLKSFERDFTMKKELDSITKLNPDVSFFLKIQNRKNRIFRLQFRLPKIE